MGGGCWEEGEIVTLDWLFGCVVWCVVKFCTGREGDGAGLGGWGGGGLVHNIGMLHVIANIGRLHLSACVRYILGSEDLWEFLFSFLH